MNIYDFLKENKLIDEEMKNLRLKKDELLKQACEEKIFEVEIGALIKEIQQILSQKYHLHDINVYFEPLEVPSAVGDIRRYAEYHKPQIIVHLFDRGMSTGGMFMARLNVRIDHLTKTSDGRYLFDHAKLIPNPENNFRQELHIPEDMKRKLVITLDPAAEYFKDPIVRKAATDCIKRRTQNTSKNTENSSKNK